MSAARTTAVVNTASEWHAALSAPSDTARAVACFDTLQQMVLSLPVAHQLRLASVIANGPDLTGTDAAYALDCAVDAAAEELREVGAASDHYRNDPYLTGIYGQRATVTA